MALLILSEVLLVCVKSRFGLDRLHLIFQASWKQANKNNFGTKMYFQARWLQCKPLEITWIGNNKVTPERVEGAKCSTGWVSLPCQTLILQVECLILQQGLGHLRGQLWCKFREVILGGDSTWGVVHFDFQVRQWIQNGRVSHWDFVWHIMKGVDGSSVHGCSWREVWGDCQEVWVRKKESSLVFSTEVTYSNQTLPDAFWAEGKQLSEY